MSTHALKPGWTFRVVSTKTAQWIGMAASASGGWIATQHRRYREDEYGQEDLGGLLMLVPEGADLAAEGKATDAAKELANLAREIEIWTGIDDPRAAALRQYLDTATT